MTRLEQEAELGEQKRKLEEQLKELQDRNDQLAKKLSGMDAEVEQQMTQAKSLLADLAKSRMAGLSPEDLLSTLKVRLGRHLWACI
jgi:predicted nuclease with TOPRIM domain